MTKYRLSSTLVRSASAMAVAAGMLVPAAAFAQDANSATTAVPESATAPTAQQDEAAGDEIVVSGIRASLDRSIDIKRNASGVVDAISAEDIGKFPDTNLAESLQRITGVSISRVNGEGSQVTVRGFSGAFNLVTVNGRQLPSSNVDTSAGNAFARGTSRSFDFQNLASEGVSTLEVYKTGRASIQSGGIGSSINIVTRKPLDARESGLTGSIGGKALYDLSVEDAEAKKNRITPELSGLLNWQNEGGTFGVGLFGSYQLRHSASVQSNPNYWNIIPLATFLDPVNSPFVRPTTVIENTPTTPFVQIPNDSRYQFSENRRERINAQGVIQFKPTDGLEVSIDGLFAQNKLREERSEQTNWFQRPFARVRFDDNPNMQSAIFLQEAIQADKGYEQQSFSTKTKLWSFGGNLKWEFLDNLTFTLDGHHSTSESNPDNDNGTSATLVSIGAPVRSSHSLTYKDNFPQQAETINDCSATNGNRGGNCNGVLDIGDLGSQVGRTITSAQKQRINEVDARFSWDLGDESQFDFGAHYNDARMQSSTIQTTQTLGDWGITDTGRVQQLAGDLVSTYCLTCKFDHFDPASEGSSLVAFRANAVDLYNVLSTYYAAAPFNRQPGVGQSANDIVNEKTFALFGQMNWNGEIGGHKTQALIGVRYETTKLKSTGIQSIPVAFRWASDNDFFVDGGSAGDSIVVRNKYNYLLPSLDFKFNVTDDLVARASFSRTLARPEYGNLFSSVTVNPPGNAVAAGGQANATRQNPRLLPLVSDNFDLSLEWYYKPSSFVSVGFFDKRVSNFTGTVVRNEPLFGLRDPSSGAPGSRSGDALAFLQAGNYGVNDINLFTYTALLVENGGSNAIAQAKFIEKYRPAVGNTPAGLDPTFVNEVLARTDIIANANDPLFTFAIQQTENTRDGKIHGFEFAWTNFFGNSGFGFAASYTKVSGNVNVDPYSNPNVDVFALTGLGDSANFTAIYDKGGLSARLSYNWRDKFLTQVNQGQNRNPLFTKAFGTLDANISYDIGEKFAISLEALNITSEPLVQYARGETNLVFAQELKPRILLGARYKF